MEQIFNYRDIPTDQRLDILNALAQIGFFPAYGGVKTMQRIMEKSVIAIGNFLMLSPSFPPLHTVHETFASYGVPSYPNRFISYFPVIVWYP